MDGKIELYTDIEKQTIQNPDTVRWICEEWIEWWFPSEFEIYMLDIISLPKKVDTTQRHDSGWTIYPPLSAIPKAFMEDLRVETAITNFSDQWDIKHKISDSSKTQIRDELMHIKNSYAWDDTSVFQALDSFRSRWLELYINSITLFNRSNEQLNSVVSYNAEFNAILNLNIQYTGDGLIQHLQQTAYGHSSFEKHAEIIDGKVSKITLIDYTIDGQEPIGPYIDHYEYNSNGQLIKAYGESRIMDVCNLKYSQKTSSSD